MAEVVDFSDVDAVVAVAQRHGVEGLLAVCSDRAVPPAAAAADRLGLPGIGTDVARRMTHKPTMRARLAEGGVPQPTYAVLTGSSDLDSEAPAAVKLPAVVKPADSGGQRGLSLVDRHEQVGAALAHALAASESGEAMLEEYVEGGELNALLVVRDGVPGLVTLSDRLRPAGVGFGVGWIHSYPSRLRADVLAQVAEVARTAVTCLGLRDGIAFPQLIATEDRVVVVEVAARIGAGQMADLVRHATGIELYEVAIAQALGEIVPDALVTPTVERPIAIRFLTASPGMLPAGTVTTIAGLERVRAARGVLDAGLYFGTGAELRPVQVDADRSGYVIATAGTAARALRRADRAARKLRVRVGEPAASSWARRRPAAFLVAIGLALLPVSVGVFGLTGAAKLKRPLIVGTRIDKTFSPVCRCRRDVAHVAFRLVPAARVAVDVVTASGRRVATLLPLRQHPAGTLRASWSGRTALAKLAHDGVYYLEVSFPALQRTLRLPGSIVLDTRRPRIEAAVTRQGRSSLVVRYRFDKPAQAALLVDGRRAELTRSAPMAGTLRWSERFPNGHPLRDGSYRLALLAIDRAGNPSRVRHLGRLRLS
ncbi:MAG TPA: hypothetical protein VLK36_06835 [Gaiellaceae bacterium]|nr:hypothetical protein [Gaiellaceae bacterium]